MVSFLGMVFQKRTLAPGQIWILSFALAIGSNLFAQRIVAGERLRLRSGDFDLMVEVERPDAKMEWFRSNLFDEPADSEYEDLSQLAFSKSSRKPTWVGTKEKRPRKKADSRATKHFVVQMRDRIAAEDLANFKSFKLKPLQYLPDDAVVIATTARKMQVLSRSSPRIYAIAPYRPEWKLAPELGASSVFSGDPVLRANIRLFPDEDAKAVLTKLVKSRKTSGFEVLSATEQTIVVEGRRSAFHVFANSDAVQWISPQHESRDSEYGNDEESAMVAAPGIVAEIRDYLQRERKLQQPSQAMIKAALMHAGDRTGDGAIDKPINLQGALLVDEKQGLAAGENHVYPVKVARSTELSVTLVYTDASHPEAAAVPLVNDLDVTVVDSNGRRFGLNDRLNDREYLSLKVAAGSYSIEVRGTNVPLGRQGYSLIVSTR